LLPILSVGRNNTELSRPADHRIIAAALKKRNPHFPHVAPGVGFNVMLLRPSDGRAALTTPISFAIILPRSASHYRMLHSPLLSGSVFRTPSHIRSLFLSLSPIGAGGNARDDIPNHFSLYPIGFGSQPDPFWTLPWVSQ
jgi:hypothetical protein